MNTLSQPVYTQSIANLSISRKARNLASLLEHLGHTVPAELSDALAWSKLLVLPSTRVADARVKVSEAKDQKSLTAAMEGLRAAIATEANTAEAEAASVLTQLRADRIIGAVLDVSADVTDLLTESFNAKAPELVSVFGNLPDMSQPGTRWSLTADQADAVQTSQRVAADLNSIYRAYREVGELSGELFEHGGGEFSDDLAEVYLLGVPADAWQATSAATLLREHSLRVDEAKAYAPLMPYAALLLAGVPLELKTPSDARKLRRDVQEY